MAYEYFFGHHLVCVQISFMQLVMVKKKRLAAESIKGNIYDCVCRYEAASWNLLSSYQSGVNKEKVGAKIQVWMLCGRWSSGVDVAVEHLGLELLWLPSFLDAERTILQYSKQQAHLISAQRWQKQTHQISLNMNDLDPTLLMN